MRAAIRVGEEDEFDFLDGQEEGRSFEPSVAGRVTNEANPSIKNGRTIPSWKKHVDNKRIRHAVKRHNRGRASDRFEELVQ
jgi:hypothetical protein